MAKTRSARMVKYLLFSMVSCAVVAGCGHKRRSRAAQTELTPQQLGEIQGIIGAGSPVTLILGVGENHYAQTLSFLKANESLGLLSIDFNPNDPSGVDISVAPLLIVTFSPAFFSQISPESLLSSMPVDSIAVNSLIQLSAFRAESGDVSTLLPLASIGARGDGSFQYRGKGTKVAVVDSGIDFGHPFFSRPGAAPAFSDFADFSGEGDFALSDASIAAAQGCDRLNALAESLRRQVAVQGSLLFGCVREARYESGQSLAFDLNGDSATSGRFGAVAAQTPEGVWVVGVDSSRDGTLSGEEMVPAFQKGQKISASLIQFGSPQGKGRQVLARIIQKLPTEPLKLSLGFDAVSHGTHVAGIVAGSADGARSGERVEGVAPEAELLPIKVAANGVSTAAQIFRGAIYAAENGADITNISMGSLNRADSLKVAEFLFGYLSEKYGTLFVMAAGNSGPTLDSGSNFGSAQSILTVGAYQPTEMSRLQNAEGEALLTPQMFWWSSKGPAYNGALLPRVVAPGMIFSAVTASSGKGYGLLNGTSMASPMVAGTAALVLEAARAHKLSLPSSRRQWARAFRRAFEDGAIPMAGYSMNEQGYGVVNAPATLAKLKEWDAVFVARKAKEPSYELFRSYSIEGDLLAAESDGSSGLGTRKISVVESPFWSEAASGRVDEGGSLDFVVSPNSPWIELSSASAGRWGSSLSGMRTLGGETIHAELQINASAKPKTHGIVSGYIDVIDSQTKISQGRILVADLNAATLDSEPKLLTDGQIAAFTHDFGEVRVKAGQTKRFFVRVPRGSKALAVLTEAKGDANIIVAVGANHSVLKIDTDNLDVRSGRRTTSKDSVVVRTEREGIFEVAIVGARRVPESVFNLEIRSSGLDAMPMAGGAGGNIRAMATDRLRSRSQNTQLNEIGASASVWMGAKRLNRSKMTMGSTLFLTAKVSGGVQFALLKVAKGNQYALSLLNDQGLELKKGVDYVDSGHNLLVFPAERTIIIAIHALMIRQGAEDIEVVMLQGLQSAPSVSVSTVAAEGNQPEHFVAEVASGNGIKDNTAALAYLYWKDAHLQSDEPVSLTVLRSMAMPAPTAGAANGSNRPKAVQTMFLPLMSRDSQSLTYEE